MTEHLYYRDSFLYEFDAEVIDVTTVESRPAIILDRTAFYPTSGGQVFDTGWIVPAGQAEKLRVAEVAEHEDGTILHFLENPAQIQTGSRVRGLIDADRRRDHMQQHTGQHVLSAAFVRSLNMPTVSFHMGVESCSIDLDTKGLTARQAETAEALANDIVTENRSVGIRFVTSEEAQKLGLRKLPPAERDQLRLIDIQDFDLTACGGTHVTATGQIGCVLLRKIEKVRQGWRVEFVCGKRAVSTARRDYTTLAESAGLLSAHVWDVPQQVRKSQEEVRALKKSAEHVLAELTDLYAGRMLGEIVESGGRKVVVRVFPDRDLGFIKLLAQRLTRQSSNVVALLGVSSDPPAVVFAQSPGQPFDMSALMKEALAKLGGRGGGSKDMAQGGPAQSAGIEAELTQIAAQLGQNQKL
ncbi:Threonyl/alanyl tRNA synthetase, SAD [Candidatus Sulfotelmatobacter sp. SbA7]|jgi:alanyl-tRNA synthetase|nr:Threonyl/alanyl tRNA synthetase, SAD [Candidatus Sulfotelmatobacter sp. SbA7]